MLRALYDWTMRLSASPHAVWLLAGIAFIESSFFPIPVDVLLIAMIIAARERAMRLAAICTVMSVLGGYFGYLIGFALFDTIGQPIIDFYGFEDTFNEFTQRYNEVGAWIVFIFGVTPFPYKVVTIASGVTQLDLAAFGLSSLAARGLRFFLVAADLVFRSADPAVCREVSRLVRARLRGPPGRRIRADQVHRLAPRRTSTYIGIWSTPTAPRTDFPRHACGRA